MSFPNSVEDKNLFGHLNAKWLIDEMKVLSEYSGGTENLKKLNVIINHIKPNFLKDSNPEEIIKKEIDKENIYKIKFFYPKSGDSIIF